MQRVIRGTWLCVAVLALACQQGPTPEMAAELEQLRAASSERDKLLQDLAENTRVMSEISSEISKVKVPASRLKTTSESPLRASRDSMLQRIRYIATKVNESDARLRESERRINGLTTINDSLKTTLEATLANFDSTLAMQRAELAAAAEQLGVLEAENIALRDTVNTMGQRENTVYYIIGTKAELVERGIISPEGGSRFLFVFGKRGQVLAPARKLDPTQFTAINKRNVTEIPLPAADGEYQIASRQNLEYLATTPNEKGRITGTDTLKIAAPEQFWTASRFLIVVKTD